MYRIAVGESEHSSTVKNVDVPWDTLVDKLTTHKVTSSKGGRYLVGGYFNGSVRKGEEMVARTLLVLDVDSYEGNIDALELDLSLWLDCAFVAYSSYQHTSEAPRVRVVIPLARELAPDDYRVFAESFCRESVLPFESFDACSWKPNQAMFMPQHPAGGEAWTMVGAGEALGVGEVEGEVVAAVDADLDGLDDLALMAASVPLDLTDLDVDAYLSARPAGVLDYDAWVDAGMGLYHQYSGSQAGFKKWVAWSEQSPKHEFATMPSKWRSFGGSAKPRTFASFMWHVNQTGGIAAVGSFYDDLLVEASGIATLEQYADFKTKIVAMSDRMLPPVHRSGIVSEVAGGFGRIHKMAKTAFTKELKASRDASSGAAGSAAPEWLRPWVYIENTLSFANSTVCDYAIKREAFNAKYDRESECMVAEKQASQVALLDYKIKTVVDEMFFPRAGQFFTYEGKDMLNSFSAKGVAPDAVLDDAGHAAVGLFLAHLAFTLADGEEQELFLNWMAYIYQNPGRRVGWAMLLQGAQGSGKSYFGNLLQELMGSNVQSLDTGAISGRFTGWATGSLVTVVEEIRISGVNKYEILDKLKPIISNATIQIEEKGRDHRTVPNFTSYLLLTNHKDAVPLSDGDRRYCALFSRVQSEEQLFSELGGVDGARAYFDALFASMRANAGALARMLLDYKIPAGFDADGRAPETRARLEMKALSVSPDRDILEGFIEANRCEVISDDILDLTWLNKLVKITGEELPLARRVTSILSEMGYSPIEGRRVKIAGNGMHYIWVRGLTKRDLVMQIVRDFHNGKGNDAF